MLGLALGRKCQSPNIVLLNVHTSFSVVLTWMPGAQHVGVDFYEALWGLSVHPKKPT